LKLRIQVGVGVACLLFSVGLSYAPCFSADFLNYDDPWLIVNNAVLEADAQDALAAIWTDFRFETRLALGAEYLPLRDSLVWLQIWLFGKSAQALHALSVLLYACTCLLIRSYLRTVFGTGLTAEVSAFAFALHPVHVESVAWLAGQKDVLALFFIALALWTHARNGRHARLWVPFLVACACFSKAMSVALILLLPVADLVRKRRFDVAVYAPSIAVIAVALATHLYVGSIVEMLATPLGGSRSSAFWSMGPVWLRYLGLCLFPFQLSIEHVVEPLTRATLQSVAGHLFVLTSFVLAFVSFRRGRVLPSAAFLWFFGPLLPVSQVLAPLQNRMADRYLWLSVLAPALLLGFAFEKLAGRAKRFELPVYTVACALGLLLMAATFDRALTFSDSVLLFTDGTLKTRSGTLSPYQLGSALERAHRGSEAEIAYREVLRRAPTGPVENARSATNNLAKLLSQRGQLLEAERILREGLVRFPRDRKMRNNLAKVLAGMGREAEAAALRSPDESPTPAKTRPHKRP
jgi:hypothetical protein